MRDKTIIYYTAQIERNGFESKVIENIKRVKGDIPVISVSQRPLDFGKNICVGEVGHSYANAFRQALIGCYEAKTPFVAMAESDCLYPKGYFDFKPQDREAIYNYDNAWVLWAKYKKYFKKEQTHGSVMYGREFAIKVFEEALKGLPKWNSGRVDFTLYKPEYKQIEFGGLPVINIKTDDAPNKGVWLEKRVAKTDTLPEWGKASDLLKQYEL